MGEFFCYAAIFSPDRGTGPLLYLFWNIGYVIICIGEKKNGYYSSYRNVAAALSLLNKDFISI
jgi:hypothetical protein